MRAEMALDNESVLLVREEFPAIRQATRGQPIIFFDGPGGSQVHGSVIEAMTDYLTDMNANAHGAFLYSRRTDEATYNARCALAEFINAPRPEEIVFGPNMTTLTFKLSQAIGEMLSPGDEVVVTRLDHDANIAPWLTLQERGVIVRHVDFHPVDCRLDMESMEKAINRRTKLVAVGYASNAVGTINNVRLITDLAHDVGAWVYADAVHFAPHGPIDVQAVQCDFLVCSAYKFFGPHLGVLYGRYDLLEMLSARKVRPAGDAPPDKFETGTANFEAICGAAAVVEYLASVGRRFGGGYRDEYSLYEGRRKDLKAGMAAIRACERDLCRKLVAGLGEIEGLRIYGILDPAEFAHRVPTVSFTMDGLAPGEIARQLDKKNIFVWDGNFYAPTVTERLGLEGRGGMVRIGLCHYNTSEEVDAFLGALSEIRYGN
jgi:cysteine desulfurase family protein (TIGR01976 family)